jgi:cytochrome c
MKDRLFGTLGLAAAAALLATAAHTASAQTQAAMDKAGCMACHAKDRKLVGPSFKDIAARYKGQAAAPALLLDKVRKGGSGVYGPVPMSPNGPDKIGDKGLREAIELILAT